VFKGSLFSNKDTYKDKKLTLIEKTHSSKDYNKDIPQVGFNASGLKKIQSKADMHALPHIEDNSDEDALDVMMSHEYIDVFIEESNNCKPL
jgi:hypothetical protein